MLVCDLLQAKEKKLEGMNLKSYNVCSRFDL